MPQRTIKLGPSAEVALASLPSSQLEHVKKILGLLRLPPEKRRGKLSVHRLREGSKSFIVRVNNRYRLIYKRESENQILIQDFVRVDHLKALEG